jgi:hypothetical protein
MRALPRAVAVACLVLATTAAPAHASETAPGGPALRQARSAWDKGSLDTAEPLYREALEKGGLAPAEVLEGYVRLGSIRASHGKKDQAIAAFRAASILDATFAVPSEAGRKGPAYAAQAKKDTAKIGGIRLSLKAPKEASSGKAFTVTAELDSAHIPIVAKIGLVARDGTSGTQGNRLASAEERVRVPEASSAGAVAAKRSDSGAGSSSSSTSASTSPPDADSGVRKGGGFWSSPWPYLIGGAALAGAGTAVYFGTRPTEQVSVGPIGVRTR